MTLKAAFKALMPSREVEKRAGLYVYRPVLNGQEWYDWAIKYGVPNPTAANDFHVTVIYSKTDVKMVPNDRPTVIPVAEDYGCPGHFCMLGPKEDVFTFCFDSYMLNDRHHQFRRNGAETTWPTYRPHMTLGKDAADFEISDEALAAAPRYIILGGELYDALKVDQDPPDDDADPEGDGEEAEVLSIEIEISMEAEKALKDASVLKSLTPLDAGALRDLAAGQIARPVAKRLVEAGWENPKLQGLLSRPERKAMNVEIKVGPIPEEIAKNLPGMAARQFSDEDDAHRMVVGFASVSTLKGQLVEDLAGDFITTETLTEFSREIVRGARAGKFDHQGKACNEVVQTFCLSDDIQKSLGIDLGCEPLLIEMHVPNDEDWSRVKSGEWSFSIAGLLYYVDDKE